MSRHRNLRKVSLGDDDYDDELAQSYDEKYSYAVSPGTSEMYMFNRSAESQNISQFIKGGIVEEEADQEENSEANSNLKSASELAAADEMFQMDKEPQAQPTTTTMSSAPGKPKLKDDLESLIDETSALFDSQTISNDLDKTIGDNDDENDDDELAEFGLGDYIKKASGQPQPFKTVIKIKETVELKPSSLDKLLDEYFSENFGASTIQVDKSCQATFNLSSLDDSAAEGQAAVTKTGSIKINEVVVASEQAAFSLSDLASQYLSTSNSSATNLATSFGGEKSLSATKGESLFQLSLENLLNKNPPSRAPRTTIYSQRNSESAPGEQDVRSSREAMTPTSFKMPSMLNELKLIPVDDKNKQRLELLKHLFIIADKSTFGDILTLGADHGSSCVENATNQAIENEFTYSTQKSRFKRRRAPKATLADLDETENNKPSKKARSGKKRGAEAALKPFDFSVPSPDDLVIAKQKLAFKRFK